MSESTIRDVLARLEEQETELRALRRRLEGPPETRQGHARKGRSTRRATGRRRLGLATLLIALLMLTPLSLAAANFTDLNPGSIHNADINLIADVGITLGCDAGTLYCPDDFVTREQMASFLARTAGLGGNAPVVNAKTAQTAGTITNQANSATIAATSTNTPNTIVLRDGNGNFTAGTITGNLTGTATNATNATNANAVDGKSANEIVRLVGVAGSTVNLIGTYQELVSVKITAPSPGYVQVTATVYAFGSAGCPCIVDFILIDVTNSTTQPIFYTLEIEADYFSDSGASSFVFPVPAGDRTFAVQALIETSAGAATVQSDADIVALFTPFGAAGAEGTGTTGPGPASQPNKQRPKR